MSAAYNAEHAVYNNPTGSATLSLSPSVNCAAGEFLVFLVLNLGGANSLTSITDSVTGNTYTIDVQKNNGTALNGALVSTVLVNPVTTTDHWTITAAAGKVVKGVQVEGFTGITTPSWTDKTASATGSTNTQATGTTAATTQANELAVAYFATTFSSTFTTPTVTPYTLFTTAPSNANVSQLGAYEVLSATGAQSLTQSSTGTNGSSVGLIATYKATAPVASVGTKAIVVGQSVMRAATRATMIRREWRRTRSGIFVPELGFG